MNKEQLKILLTGLILLLIILAIIFLPFIALEIGELLKFEFMQGSESFSTIGKWGIGAMLVMMGGAIAFCALVVLALAFLILYKSGEAIKEGIEMIYSMISTKVDKLPEKVIKGEAKDNGDMTGAMSVSEEGEVT